jgi:hypothetical protein
MAVITESRADRVHKSEKRRRPRPALALFAHPDPWDDGAAGYLDALDARLSTKEAPGPLGAVDDSPSAQERAQTHAAFRARYRAARPALTLASETTPAPAAAPLGTTESKVSPAGQKGAAARRVAGAASYSDRRLTRMTLRDLVQDVTTLKSLRGCERSVLQGGVSLRQRGDEGRASFSGVWRCGSVWACPCCSATVRAARAAELERLAVAWIKAGHGLAMATLTVRHWNRAKLGPQLDGVAKSWQKVQAGKWWGQFRAEYGMAGVTRAMEITHGKNGWHTHLHVLVWTDKPMDRATADRMEGALYEKWLAKVSAAGLGKPTRAHGVTVDPVRRGKDGAADVARYVAKIQEADGAEKSMGNEMTRGDLKTGRKESRVPFEIIAEHFRRGDDGDLALWLEYEEATKGRRMLTWTRGLREQLSELLEEELDERTDEEIVADGQDDGDEVAYFPAETWKKHIVTVPGRRPALINAAEAGGQKDVRKLIESWGLVWGRDVLPAPDQGV